MASKYSVPLRTIVEETALSRCTPRAIMIRGF